MKPIHAFAAYLLLVAYPVWVVAEQAPSSPSAADIYTSKLNRKPDQVIAAYDVQDPVKCADYVTLALAHYAGAKGDADFQMALDAANRAFPLAENIEAKAMCLELIAQCHGALGHYDMALRAALQGTRLSPRSKELASLRFAYAHKVGDVLAEDTAKEHLMQVDPSFAKHPTCDPVTGCIIVISILCATGLAVAVTAANAKDPEVAKRLAQISEQLLGTAATLGMLVIK